MLIHSPKTERHEGRESRIIPIFPEIRPHLQEVFDAAEPGTSWVITRYRRANQNLRTTFRKIINRAALQPWPRLFQNLRATRETELALKYPLHIVTAWIGNSAKIAERHYLQVPDEFFDDASNIDAEKAAHNPAQYTAANHGKRQQNEKSEEQESAFSGSRPAFCSVGHDTPMEMEGIEPSFPRCDRGVLPLHHIPGITLFRRYSTGTSPQFNRFLGLVQKQAY